MPDDDDNDDDKPDLDAKIAAAVETALSGPAFTKAILKASKTAVEASIKGLDLGTQIAEAVKAALPEPVVADDGGGDGEESIEVKKLRADVEKMRIEGEKARSAHAASEAARTLAAMRTQARDALIAGGADPKRVKFVMAHLEAEGLLKVGDDGTPIYVHNGDFGEELQPVSEGLTNWLQTDDGKGFMPPVGTEGTGDGVGAGQAQGGSPAPRTKDGRIDFAAARQGRPLDMSVLRQAD